MGEQSEPQNSSTSWLFATNFIVGQFNCVHLLFVEREIRVIPRSLSPRNYHYYLAQPRLVYRLLTNELLSRPSSENERELAERRSRTLPVTNLISTAYATCPSDYKRAVRALHCDNSSLFQTPIILGL